MKSVEFEFRQERKKADLLEQCPRAAAILCAAWVHAGRLSDLTVAPKDLHPKADHSYALFFGHLAIEKLLKALHGTKLRQHAPPIHNLVRLARTLGLDLNENRIETLITITAFNIEARYPDFKRSFREKCTEEYSRSQMSVIKETYEWLKSHLT